MQSNSQLCAWVENPGPQVDVEIRSIPVPRPGPDEVLVKLAASGVCHSDCDFIHGNTPMTTHIAGHEGVGRVIEVGADVSPDMLGTRVGISFLHRSCGKCEICAVDETHCPFQDNSGRNVPGTFQQYATASAAYVIKIPEAIPSEIAAPLLCGGRTMYGALSKAKLRPGDYVVMPGAGGGLGHLGIQIGAHFGYKVIALDIGEEKRSLCMKSGATHFFDISTDDVSSEVRKITTLGAHAIVCVAGSASAYDGSISMLRNCGTLVCVGIPRATYRLAVNPFECLVRGITIVGATVGTRPQMEELLQLAAVGKIRSHVETFPFEEINNVLRRLSTSAIAGRAVVLMPA